MRFYRPDDLLLLAVPSQLIVVEIDLNKGRERERLFIYLSAVNTPLGNEKEPLKNINDNRKLHMLQVSRTIDDINQESRKRTEYHQPSEKTSEALDE